MSSFDGVDCIVFTFSKLPTVFFEVFTDLVNAHSYPYSDGSFDLVFISAILSSVAA